jgi:hypothetical protein
LQHSDREMRGIVFATSDRAGWKGRFEDVEKLVAYSDRSPTLLRATHREERLIVVIGNTAVKRVRRCSFIASHCAMKTGLSKPEREREVSPAYIAHGK